MLQKALAADSTHVLAYNSLGNVHLFRKEYDQAVSAYQRAARFDSANPGIRRNLAVARKLRDQTRER